MMKFLRTNPLFLLVFSLSFFLSSEGFASSKHYKQHSSFEFASQGQVKKVKKKVKKCCEETQKGINGIENELKLIEGELVNVENTVDQINETTTKDLAIDEQTLDTVNTIQGKVSSIANVVNQINGTTIADFNVDLEILGLLKGQSSCVTLISKLPYQITEPGYYKLACDLVFDPFLSQYAPPDQRAVQAAITIKSSNVHLDLGPYTLSQAIPANPSEQVPYCIGILVPDPLPTSANPNAVGLESVYITGDNGAISDFSMYGVRIFAHISDILLANFTIKNCGALASKALRPVVYGFPYLPHQRDLISSFGPTFGVAGLSIGESIGLGEGPLFFSNDSTTQLNVVNRTQNVRLNRVNCINNFAKGAWIKLTTNLTIEDCHFDYTWSDDPGSNSVPAYPVITAYGVDFSDVGIVPDNGNVISNGNTDPCNLNVTVSNCTFNKSSLKGDYKTRLSVSADFGAFGCVDTRCRNVVFSNCQFNDSSCTFPNVVGAQTRSGGYGAGGIEDVTFLNCHFDGSSNLGRVQGFSLGGSTQNEPFKSSRNIQLIDCTANNLQCRADLILPAPVLSTSTVQGYAFSGIKDLYVENCVSNDLYVFAPCPSTGSTSSSFSSSSSNNNPASQVENWVFRNCTTARNRAIEGGTIWGFNTFIPSLNNATSLTFEGCVSTGHQATVASNNPAWSNGTSYSVGVLVLFAGKNYVSLANANLNNQPNVSPTQWSLINIAPAAWLSTTTYGIGDQVSFTDSTGHLNEYISTIAGNVGNYPNAPGPGLGLVTPNWIQTNFYPTWSPIATYQVGSIVGYQGVNYRSLVASNLNFVPPSNPGQWSSNTLVVQLVAGGFFSQQNQVAGIGGPEIYLNCIASQNKGAPGPVPGIARYSAGFLTTLAVGTLYQSCTAANNNYGFLLSNSSNCVVSNCESYNNGVSGIGEGFTDVGTGSVSAPTQSKSMFEANTAYNNGGGILHVGQNGNYNMWVDPALTIRPMLLNCSNSAASCTLTLPSTTYFAGKHNKSTIN